MTDINKVCKYACLYVKVIKSCLIACHYRNVKGLRMSMVVFHLFEKLRYSKERSNLYQG